MEETILKMGKKFVGIKRSGDGYIAQRRGDEFVENDRKLRHKDIKSTGKTPSEAIENLAKTLID